MFGSCVEFTKNQNMISTSRMDKRVILWSTWTNESNYSYVPLNLTWLEYSFHQSESIIGVSLENENFVVLDAWSQRIIQSHAELHNKSITTMSFYLSDNLLF
jgi:hypothetical protein